MNYYRYFFEQPVATNKSIHLISASQCITPPNIINHNFNALFVIVPFDKFKK